LIFTEFGLTSISSFLRMTKNAKISEYYIAKRRNQLGKHFKNGIVQLHFIELLLLLVLWVYLWFLLFFTYIN